MLGIQIREERDVGQKIHLFCARAIDLFVTSPKIAQIWGIIFFAQHQRHLRGVTVSF